MTTGTIDKYMTITAKIISAILHPLLVPLYGTIIIFSAPTLFGYLPFQVKRIIFSVIFINNVIVPLSLLPYFKYRRLISSWVIDDRKERIIPLLACSFFYSVTVYIILRFHVPLFLKSYVIAVALLAIAATVINFWWKISIHSMGAGALIFLITVLSVRMQAPLTWLLIASIITGGLVMSSRLWLNTHSPKEVWTGFLLGSAGTALTLFLL
jgi:membrane-associated phospholipid phosphatase